MSKIISLAVGVPGVTNVQVKQRAAKLNFVLKYAGGVATPLTNVLQALGTGSIKIDLQSAKGATQNLIPGIPIAVLAELYSAIEGYIQVDDFLVGATNWKAVRFSMELSFAGALNLDNDSQLVCNVEGMDEYVGLDIFATDFPATSTKAIKLNVLRFSAGAPQSISLTEGAMLHLPIAAFSELQLVYPEGISVNLSKDEIMQWCIEGNKEMGVSAGLTTYGYINYLSMNVVRAIQARVTLNADTNGYLFTQVDL